MKVSLEDFIKENIVKFDCYLDDVPLDVDDWRKSSFAWRCTITSKNNKLKTFVFYKGEGHKGFKKLDGTWRFATQKEIQEAKKGFGIKVPKPIPPSCDELLSCLICDCNSILDFPTFKSWCKELDYNNDSIKAQKLYFDIQKIYDDMIELFGYGFISKIDLDTLN